MPLGGRVYRMHHMYDTVHVDEKWFNLYKDTNKYYLTATEQLPYRSCPNKRYIGKIMFLAAVARPRYDFHRKQYFDGKLGIWPIVEETKAARSSANRPKGAIVTKSVTMTRKRYRTLLIENVSQQSELRCQDNAGPYVLKDDSELEAAGSIGGWTIKMRCQPPRSPDLNVLDLGYFSSIQALQYRKACYDTSSLITAVHEAFQELRDPRQVFCYATESNGGCSTKWWRE
ncbi:hypothetical protein PC110_g22920 [Phytophthora cactorum]|uniref:Uncharacterized protein n=1 Tax=Phytophthora cactorum TaxID=29920 RepID=A0A329R725_9STRA|nr:hypothetical protein PC110_g22920 [Phytophthora cactorum]